MNEIILIIGLAGITNIITDYDGPFGILERIRNVLRPHTKLITCSTCLGFWVGLWGGFILDFNIFYAIIIGGAVSLLGTIIDKISVE